MKSVNFWMLWRKVLTRKTVIPKAQRVQQFLFCVSTPKETEDAGDCLPCFEWAVCLCFRLHFGYRKNIERKKLTTQWLIHLFMEVDGANFVSVKSWIWQVSAGFPPYTLVTVQIIFLMLPLCRAVVSWLLELTFSVLFFW